MPDVTRLKAMYNAAEAVSGLMMTNGESELMMTDVCEVYTPIRNTQLNPPPSDPALRPEQEEEKGISTKYPVIVVVTTNNKITGPNRMLDC